MSVTNTATIVELRVQVVIAPFSSTVRYASVVHPFGGVQVAEEAASVSDLNDVARAQANGSSQITVITASATRAITRAVLLPPITSRVEHRFSAARTESGRRAGARSADICGLLARTE